MKPITIEDVPPLFGTVKIGHEEGPQEENQGLTKVQKVKMASTITIISGLIIFAFFMIMYMH